MYVNPKKYPEIKRKYFNSLTKKEFFEVIEKHKLICDKEKGEVAEFHLFDFAMNYKHIIQLAEKHGVNWYSFYCIGMKNDNPYVTRLTLQQILSKDFPIHIPEEEMILPIPNIDKNTSNKKTHILGKPVENTRINLFCKACRKNLKPGKECSHSQDNIVYRARFYKIEISDPRIYLEAQNYQQAIIEAHNLRLAILRDGYIPKKKIELPKASSILLTELIDDYISFKRNEGVSKNLKSSKDRSGDYINEIIKYLGHFRDGLISSGYDLRKITPNQLNQELSLKVYDYLDKLINPKSGIPYFPNTFNKFLGEITSFNLYLIKNKKFKIDNYFGELKRKKPVQNPVAISKGEIELFFKKIDELVETKYVHEHFNHFDLDLWLRNTYLFELATSRRRDDFIMARWNDIYEEEGCEFLKVKDYKVSRQKDMDVFFHILITPELRKILVDFGYDTYRDTNEYIVFPESLQIELISKKIIKKIKGRKRLNDQLSRSFGVIYKLAGGSKDLGAKSLKKAGITLLSTIINLKDLHIGTGHRSPAIVLRSYVDKKERQKILLEARLEKQSKFSSRAEDNTKSSVTLQSSLK